jgi:cytochrome b
MNFVLVMWAVWVGLVVITAALYLYRSRLQRDEEDQIFLDDSFSQEKAEQEQIAASVNKIEPTLRVFQWVVAAATLFVIVYYIKDIVNHI